MAFYMVQDDGRLPVRVEEAAIPRLAKHGRSGVILRVDGDPHTGTITKVADIGATRLATERAVDVLRRAFGLRRHRQRLGNVASSIVAGAAAG